MLKHFQTYSSLETFCKSQNYDTVWIIGGEKSLSTVYF